MIDKTKHFFDFGILIKDTRRKMREETRVPRAFVLVESRVTWPLIQERILIIIGTKNNDLILFS